MSLVWEEYRATRVEVTADPRALGFYERVGFVAPGDVRATFGPGVGMTRPL
jgi:hypothetical protein